MRVPMHFYAIRRGRHSLMRPEHLLLRLREGRRAGLAVGDHAIVEGEAIPRLRHATMADQTRLLLVRGDALTMMLGNLWSEVILHLVAIKGTGQIGELLAIVLRAAVGIAKTEVQIEVVEVEQGVEVILVGGIHGLERLCVRPRLAVHCAHGARRRLYWAGNERGRRFLATTNSPVGGGALHLLVAVLGAQIAANICRRDLSRRQRGLKTVTGAVW